MLTSIFQYITRITMELNETFMVGMDEHSVRLVKCAYDCLRVAIDKCKPVHYTAIGESIQKS